MNPTDVALEIRLMDPTDVALEIRPEGRGVFTPELLDRCISCGFCLPACPTYVLTGVETSSPRGRINLMRALETGVLAADDPTVLEESSFCLGCRACESVCPAGVQYGELVEEWRDHLWNGRRRPARLWPLLWAVDSPRRVGEALPGTIVSTSGGCAAHLAGVLAPGRVKEFSPWMIDPTLSPISQLKEPGDDRATASSAGGTPPATTAGGRLRIGLQDSCHLRNGLGVWREPRELIARVGDYVELSSAAVCCGAAGSYSVVRPTDSARILDPHLDEIAAADLDLVVIATISRDGSADRRVPAMTQSR